MSNYTEAELNEAQATAEKNNDLNMLAVISGHRQRLFGDKGQGSQPKLPMMQAYIDRCIARCRPKGAK